MTHHFATLMPNSPGRAAHPPGGGHRIVWYGIRTHPGAEAQSILMSVLRTCTQQRRDTLDFISRTLRGNRPLVALAPLGP